MLCLGISRGLIEPQEWFTYQNFQNFTRKAARPFSHRYANLQILKCIRKRKTMLCLGLFCCNVKPEGYIFKKTFLSYAGYFGFSVGHLIEFKGK